MSLISNHYSLWVSSSLFESHESSLASLTLMSPQKSLWVSWVSSSLSKSHESQLVSVSLMSPTSLLHVYIVSSNLRSYTSGKMEFPFLLFPFLISWIIEPMSVLCFRSDGHNYILKEEHHNLHSFHQHEVMILNLCFSP